MKKNLYLLIKPASGVCNLRCNYCFYRDVMTNRACENYGMMEEAVIEEIVKKAFDYADGAITFAFQGGEPMLRGLDFYKSFINLVSKYSIKDVKTSFTIQTNGVLINEEWAKFYSDYNFLVGLSMDGYKEVHDLNRIDQEGKGTFENIFSLFLVWMILAMKMERCHIH